MIVKNEAAIMRRCLQSTLPIVDFALIVDTGSCDGTQQIIRDFLVEAKLPGVIIEEPWQDFAYNRSFALQKLREQVDIDYGLTLDADEILIFADNFDTDQFKQQLQHDLYDVPCHYGEIVYLRTQLFSNRINFYYKGVLHEFLEAPVTLTRSTVQGFYNIPLQDSARNNNPYKFQKDATTLEQALQTETDPFMSSRYTFYLAQSYRDCGAATLALAAYLRRAQMGGWVEEVYYSLLSAARLKEALQYQEADIIQTYMAAHETLPERLEAVHGAIRYCRLQGKFHQAYILGKYAHQQAETEVGLFLEKWVYAYGIQDELAIAAYWVGHYQESFELCLTILQQAKIPSHMRQRIRDNAGFAIEKLGQAELANRLPE
jgi:glycosyltransferase involved in cell wall biosynthesis